MYSAHDGIHMPPVMSYIVDVMTYTVDVMAYRISFKSDIEHVLSYTQCV